MRLGLALSVVFLFSFIKLQIQPCFGCLEKERIGLLEIKAYFVTLGGNFELRSWATEDRGSNCCTWKRVKCSNIKSTTRHITDLYLNELLLFTSKEEIVMFNVSLLSPFQELQSLDLSYNSFEGWSNNEGFSRLKKLESLDLSFNSLNGSLSAQDFLNLKSLKVLDLSDNGFSGSIKGLCTMKGLIALDLSNNMFNGQLPECLGFLTNLKVLDLSNNLFTGNFPSFTSNLTSLEYLSLSENYLQGLFSLTNLANHSKLQGLIISSRSPGAQVETDSAKWFPKFQLKFLIIQNCYINKDQGSMIPSFLLYQHDLEFVDLSHNIMVGEFPNWLIHNNSRMDTLSLRNNSIEGNLKLSSIKKDIRFLDISNNNVSGLLPKDIGIVLPSIQSLNLSFNSFEGNIPISIGEMVELVFMDLSHNHFSGELPQNLATNWTYLTLLRLSDNFLQGNIPRFLENSNLNTLYLNNNNFNGTLEEVLPKLPIMSVLDISNNSIHGEIPSSIGNFIYMKVLLMAQNQLEGEIHNVFYNMTELQILDLSENRLFGSISDFSISSLRFLYLQKNALSGCVPFSLSKTSDLVTLDLRDNKFSGYVPNWIDKLSQLRVLLLGGNNFEGHIPIQLCQLSRITIMDLSRNTINGSIPSCFESLPFGPLPRDDDHVPNFEIPMNHMDPFVDPFPFFNYGLSLLPPTIESDSLIDDEVLAVVEFRTKSNYYSYRGNILENMTGLDLSCNKLSGIIPSQIGNFIQIRSLNLSHNNLSGSVPNTFSNLNQIESLDLSFNYLSGSIPMELTQLNFLSIFNVSYNNLSGMIPNTGQFATFDDESYKGNPDLCGPLLKHKCEGGVASTPPSESNNTEEEMDEIVDMVAFYWSFTASSITIFLGFIVVLCINPYWRMAWFYFIGKVIHKCFPSFPLY